MPRILLVEDDPVLRSSVERCLKKKGLEIVSFTSGFDALKAAERKVFHLLLADLRIPDMDGMDLIRAFQKFQPQASFVVMTGYGSVGSAVDAMKLGAFHYLTKPFDVAEL